MGAPAAAFIWDAGITSAEEVSVEISSQSFSSPFTYDASVNNWSMSGATIPVKRSRSSVVLNPPITQRFGFMFNKQRLASNNFDVTLLLHFDTPPSEIVGTTVKDPPIDQTFGIWFSTKEDVAAQMKEHTKKVFSTKKTSKKTEFQEILKSADFDSFTIVPRMFSGVAAVISTTDWKAKRELSATLVNSNGSVKVEGIRSFPTGDGGSAHLFGEKDSSTSLKKYSLSYMRLRLSVRPDSVSLYMLDGLEWRLVIQKSGTIFVNSDGGYLGLTSFTGNMAGHPYGVRISSLRVSSYDLQSLASDPSNVAVQMFSREGLSIAKMMSEEFFGKAKDQVDVLLKLERIIDKYRQNSVSSLALLNKQVNSFQTTATRISSQVTTLGHEVNTVFHGSTNKSADMANLVNEIQSIHQVLSQTRQDEEEVLRHVKTKKRALDKTFGADRHVNYFERRINSQSAELGEVLETNNNTTLMLLLLVVGGTILMGLFFYFKLNAYAKKAHTF